MKCVITVFAILNNKMKKVQLKETELPSTVELTYIFSWGSRDSNESGCQQDVTREVVCSGGFKAQIK